MNNKFIYIACFSLLLSSQVHADTLLIDVISKEPSNNSSGLLRPNRGQTMQQVASSFGEPVKKSAAIGQPPITRWNYDGFSVYFEQDTVIHAVVNKPKVKLAPQ